MKRHLLNYLLVLRPYWKMVLSFVLVSGMLIPFQNCSPGFKTEQASLGIDTSNSESNSTAEALALAVQGAPNLPLNGTTTKVTITFTSGTPTSVQLSRDGNAAFATYPSGTFFTLAADGKSISGDWCISSSCWGNIGLSHTLKVDATYANGNQATTSLILNVADALPLPTPPLAGVEYVNITTAMWSEIQSQQSAFGDNNDCKSRVDAVPTTGYVLQPGGNIASALASNNVVILQTGVYNISARFGIPTGKKLVGGPGQHPILDASSSSDDFTVYLGNNAVIANIELRNTPGIGIVTFDLGAGNYSHGSLMYQVLIHDGGMGANGASQSDGSGIKVSGGSYNTCVVSVEVYNTYNQVGTDGSTTSVTAHGGNSDGIANNFGAYNNTFIDAHVHNAGDDGIDMWDGGQSFWYYSAFHDNGKNSVYGVAGDGNGIKLGRGSVSHKFYKVSANNNLEGGWNLNGNSEQPVMVKCSATGNASGEYINGVVAP